MHAADFGLGILGANAIVGAAAPIADRRRLGGPARPARTASSLTYFGDGAVSQGVLLETLQPGRAVARAGGVRLREQRFRDHRSAPPTPSPAPSPDAPRPSASRRARVDGMDPRRCSPRPPRAVARARAGGGPDAAGMRHLPLRRPPHLGARRPAPLPHRRGGRAAGASATRSTSKAPGSPTSSARAIDAEIEALLEEAVQLRPGRPAPRSGHRAGLPLRRRHAARRRRRSDADPVLSQSPEPGARRRDGRAIRRCACSARTSRRPSPTSPRACSEEFGPDRVLDMPISEQAFTSFATGAAMAGHAPADRVSRSRRCCSWSFEQIANQAHKFSLMTGGQTACPGDLPAARLRARATAGRASTPTTRTACSRTSA